MSKNVTQYDLLISCPGDIQSEINLINQAVRDFNERYTDTIGISIRTKHWSKNSYAQSGGKPQELLNGQFIKDCDAAVALFWTRFGTPTDEYGSGTEEEIEIMLANKKQVFMYFSDKPVSPSKQNAQEYGKVQAFREKYKDRGIYFTYSSDEEFSKLFIAHLSQHFLSIKKVEELKEKRVPQLILRGIDECGKLCESVPIHPFKLCSEHNMNKYRAQIIKMYHDISEFGNLLLDATNDTKSLFCSPITIKEERKEFLTQVAKQFELELPEDFFNLGNLSKSNISNSPVFGYSLEGTEAEKQKYNLIVKLYETIDECLKWIPIEKAFSGIKCIELAVENSGTAIDEDIEITITLDKQVLLHFEEFPPLEEDTMGDILNEYDMRSLFGICGTSQYMNYYSATKSGLVDSPALSANTNIPSFPLNLYEREDYSNDYKDELKNVFCYDIYSEGEDYIMKLKFDYIKHHTTIAFPTIIFLKDAPDIINYKIGSRNSADVVSGHITVLK